MMDLEISTWAPKEKHFFLMEKLEITSYVAYSWEGLSDGLRILGLKKVKLQNGKPLNLNLNVL